MSRIAYVNGRYAPFCDALVHVEDRGYQFADGVYEVISLCAGRLIDELPHLDRLGRSLDELQIAWPIDRRPLQLVLREVVRRNRLRDGLVYLQISRGSAPRDHKFPVSCEPSLVITVRRARPRNRGLREKGAVVITSPDIRWKRCDIKSVSLLPNVLAMQEAVEAGADEAWLVDEDGLVTEGTASNAWIVTEKGDLITRDACQAILDGITRRTVLSVAAREGVGFHERPFTVAEAQLAREAFITSTSALVLPIVQIDGETVGDGRPGQLTRRLIREYESHVRASSNRSELA